MTDATTSNKNSAVKKLNLDSGDQVQVINRGHYATLGMYDQSGSRSMPDASPRDLRKIAKALTEVADAIDGGAQPEKATETAKKPDIKAVAEARKSTAKGSAKKSK